MDNIGSNKNSYQSKKLPATWFDSYLIIAIAKDADRKKFSVFQCQLNDADKQDTWVHCFSLLHKNYKLLEYSSGVFQNLFKNLCSNHSTESVGFFMLSDAAVESFVIHQTRKKPTIEPLFISILCLASSISFIHTLYTPFFEALKVLTQNWEQKLCGKASPNGAELVRLHRVGHSRAQNWCCYDNMVVLMTEFVNQFGLHTFTMMKKQIRFSMGRYGNVKTLEGLGNTVKKYKK